MRVEELNAAQMSTDDIEQWCDVLNAMTDSDMPGEPQWNSHRLRDYLSQTLPGSQRKLLVAYEDRGHFLGHSVITRLSDDPVGIVEIATRPEVRGQGIGKLLLRHTADSAEAMGCDTVCAEVIATTPAVGFYDRLGFEIAELEHRHLLRWDNIDWEFMETAAKRVAADYELRYFPGSVPASYADSYADVKAHLHSPEAPIVWLPEWRPSAEANQLATAFDTLRKRGMRPHIMVAINERTDEVVGLTEVVVSNQRPTRADQYDTVVASGHRSYGLAMTMKAALLLELRQREPQLHDVQTWTSPDAQDVNWVNAQLGFVHDVNWYDYEIPLHTLKKSLNDGT
ncbi:GNAT family N-acetyltransferase [Haloglycomyces albus]|uniref:GNAT family N-acetyltransferase n=1 Tax=Haloglycomyces albus TaxID=526067 RepID=UPI00046CD2E4|nr:GNAT family N-acetyltransferase [Haloglycomyces albus]